MKHFRAGGRHSLLEVRAQAGCQDWATSDLIRDRLA